MTHFRTINLVIVELNTLLFDKKYVYKEMINTVKNSNKKKCFFFLQKNIILRTRVVFIFQAW